MATIPSAVGGLLGIGGGSADPNDTEDCHGHGSHVAGTVGGFEFGVAKGAILHPVRVLDCNGSGLNSGVIAGVDWVMANNQQPAVANMSLGGGNSAALDDAVRAAINAGVSFVVATGNDNADACTGSPNRLVEAITVGSTTATDARSSFSNKGSCVDVFAPGSSILSAGTSNDSSTATMSGTSMASPHVAGIAALYLAANQTAQPGAVFSSVIGAAVGNRLSGIGTGSPNILAQNDVAGAGTDLPPLAAMMIYCSDLQCSFDANASSDDGALVSYQWNFGDGAQSNSMQTTYTYSAAGSYTVSLQGGQLDSIAQGTGCSWLVPRPAATAHTVAAVWRMAKRYTFPRKVLVPGPAAFRADLRGPAAPISTCAWKNTVARCFSAVGAVLPALKPRVVAKQSTIAVPQVTTAGA
ncbi:MAG: serine protease [Paracoccaceae bacterium]|jgi:serine protease